MKAPALLIAVLAALAAAAPACAEETAKPSTSWTDDMGEAAQTLAGRAREADKTLVIWIFDQSLSMADDREALSREVGGLLAALQKKVDDRRYLSMAVFGAGKEAVLVQEPTNDRKRIAQAIRAIPEDESGRENLLGAVLAALARFKDHPAHKIVVLVCDESGDDADRVDEVEKELLAQQAQFFCIGAEAAFQTASLSKRVQYTVDNQQHQANVTLQMGPESKGVEWYAGSERVIPKPEGTPSIAIGPMGLAGNVSAQPEDVKVPSGFGFYAPARLAAATGGAYLILPDPESPAIRIDREKMHAHYQPSYDKEGRAPTAFGRRVQDLIAKARRPRDGHGFCLCQSRHVVSAPQAEARVRELLENSRKEVTAIDALMAEFHETLEEARAGRGRDYQVGDGEVAARSDARWDAHAMLALVVLQAERARLEDRIRLLDEIAQSGRFANAVGIDPKTSCRITFTPTGGRYTKKQYGTENRSYVTGPNIHKEMQERHAGTPWAWHAKEIEEKTGPDKIHVEFDAPRQAAKGVKVPPLPRKPGPKGY